MMQLIKACARPGPNLVPPRLHGLATLDMAELTAIADVIFKSREGPKTQIAEQNSLELLVRDETPIPNLQGRRSEQPLTTSHEEDNCRIEFVVGPPSTALLLKCAICRQGLGHFSEEFDQDKLLTEDGSQHHSGKTLDLVRLMARPELLSLEVQSSRNISVPELEEWATAFRARIAFEASLTFTPIDNVDQFFPAYIQPPIVRQIGAEDDAHGTFHFPGDRLLGRVTKPDDECALRYLRGVGARDAFSAYMSYYQNLEYHMET
jgi:hypothetical protein